MNAMHLVWQHPPATGNTLVQYGTQCIHARGRAVHRGHIPTGALSCSETEKQIQTDLLRASSVVLQDVLLQTVWMLKVLKLLRMVRL